MSGRRAQAEQLLAGALRRTQVAARGQIPAPLRRALRPVSSRLSRTATQLERSRPAAAERDARARLRVTPEDGDVWCTLAASLAAQGRADDAIEAWLRGASHGALERMTIYFRHAPGFRDVAASSAVIGRIRQIAAAKPGSAPTQLLAGTFLLDHGHLDEGRQLTIRGYELLLNERGSTFAEMQRSEAPRLSPQFFVIGPHKTGTSSLHAMLSQHPQVVAPGCKELQFLDHPDRLPYERYEEYFPGLPADAGFLTGEASPSYLASPEALAAVSTRFPTARVVVLHRDPVARAYSHFQMVAGRSFADPRTFELAVEHELERLGPIPPLTLDEVPDRPGTYLIGSCILPRVRTWVDALGAERVMVLESRALSQDRDGTLDALFDYLGLPPAQLPAIEDRNVHTYPPIQPAVAERLRDWFAPHEAALESFLATHPARIPAS